MKQFIVRAVDLREDLTDFMGFGRSVGNVSRQLLEEVIGRAILDKEFRQALFADPTTALAEYQLSDEELVALKWVDAESLDACGDSIGELLLSKILSAKPGVTGQEAVDPD